MIESEYFLLAIFALDCESRLVVDTENWLYLWRFVNGLIFLHKGPYSNGYNKFLSFIQCFHLLIIVYMNFL